VFGAGAVVLGQTPNASTTAILSRRLINRVTSLSLKLLFQTPYQANVFVVGRGGDSSVPQTGYVRLRRSRPVRQPVRSALQA